MLHQLYARDDSGVAHAELLVLCISTNLQTHVSRFDRNGERAIKHALLTNCNFCLGVYRRALLPLDSPYIERGQTMGIPVSRHPWRTFVKAVWSANPYLRGGCTGRYPLAQSYTYHLPLIFTSCMVTSLVVVQIFKN